MTNGPCVKCSRRGCGEYHSACVKYTAWCLVHESEKEEIFESERNERLYHKYNKVTARQLARKKSRNGK